MLSNKLTRSNEQDFLLVLYDKPSSKGFIISPLPGIFFSKMRPCSDNTPPPPPKISVFLALSPHRTLTTLLILEACSLLVTNLYDISQPRIFSSRHWRVQWGMNDCHPNASCVNTQGSHNCSCNPTYFGNGSICEGKFVIFRPRYLIIYVFLNVINEHAEFVMFDKWRHKSLWPNTLRNYCHF